APSSGLAPPSWSSAGSSLHKGYTQGLCILRCGGGTAAPGKSLAIPATDEVLLEVEGLKCGSCVSKAEAVLCGIPGVDNDSVSVNFATGTARFITPRLGREQVQGIAVGALAKAGFPTHVTNSPGLRYSLKAQHAPLQRRLFLSVALAAASLVGHFLHKTTMLPLLRLLLLSSDWGQCLLATLCMSLPAREIVSAGLKRLAQ
ncbi:unnamed protein product, partial [Chrysoparadoxa australica]